MTTWQHPRSKYWHMLVYTSVWQRAKETGGLMKMALRSVALSRRSVVPALPTSRDARSRFKKACNHELKWQCQTKPHQIQNTKVVKLQQFANTRDLRNFYTGMKELFGPVPDVCRRNHNATVAHSVDDL